MAKLYNKNAASVPDNFAGLFENFKTKCCEG